jgi:hypothetical protein
VARRPLAATWPPAAVAALGDLEGDPGHLLGPGLERATGGLAGHPELNGDLGLAGAAGEAPAGPQPSLLQRLEVPAAGAGLVEGGFVVLATKHSTNLITDKREARKLDNGMKKGGHRDVAARSLLLSRPRLRTRQAAHHLARSTP